MQWVALFILTIGCAVQRVNFYNFNGDANNMKQISFKTFNTSTYTEKNGNILSNVLDRAEVLFVILQVIFLKIEILPKNANSIIQYNII